MAAETGKGRLCTMTVHRLFVYGTLRPGEPNYRRLRWAIADGEPPAPRTLWLPAVLVDWGPYPALYWDDGSEPHPLVGTVLTVREFKPFDDLEECPRLYQRRIIETGDGPAWIYYMEAARAPRPHAAVIAHGDWVRWRRDRAARRQHRP